jgi:hypothetical protein
MPEEPSHEASSEVLKSAGGAVEELKDVRVWGDALEGEIKGEGVRADIGENRLAYLRR